MGAVVVAFIACLAPAIARKSFMNAWDFVLVAGVAAVLLWVMIMIAWASNIEVSDKGVTVTNLLVWHRVPWNVISSIRLDDGMVIRLTDGRKVGSVQFGGSLGGALLGYRSQRKYVERLNEALAESRKAASAAGEYQMRVRIPAGPLIVAFAVFCVLFGSMMLVA
ncbi:hypothetical protein ACQP25_33420 [Microtetraspora malaysiensis]|uniref:hypothetical protein n=1 Tax=Microtetraspora malaysiensis TaxID=161358 RepID=UPI003D8DABE5